jgi:hypothetical protein
MPAGFTLRNRLRYEWLEPSQVLTLTRSGLENTGLAVATVTARAVNPRPGEYAGVVVRLDGDAPQDRTPACDMNADPLCAGEPVFNFYSMEVVQRIGYDSFTPDNGVLIAKNKDREGRTCGYNCFTWVIDAHPEDIDMVDFVKPDGTKVMRTIADYRQLNDALFHAGLNSGSQFEWTDVPNRLHFYVVDLTRDARGILSYTVAVRALNDGGTQKRSVAVAAVAAARPVPNTVNVRVTNAGSAVDVVRLTAVADGQGWQATLANALVALGPGEAADVPVHIVRGPGAGTVTFTGTSESNSAARAVTTLASGR